MAEIEHFCDPDDKSHPKFYQVCTYISNVIVRQTEYDSLSNSSTKPLPLFSDKTDGCRVCKCIFLLSNVKIFLSAYGYRNGFLLGMCSDGWRTC